jgi:hypothetical protein
MERERAGGLGGGGRSPAAIGGGLWVFEERAKRKISCYGKLE